MRDHEARAGGGCATALRRREALALFVTLAACRRDTGARCAFCGMRIAAGSHWAAGAVSARGEALAFDTPGCMFRHRNASGGVRGEWVTEYYGPADRRTDARAVRYAVGSDVVGPMGPDVVPLDPAREAVFTRDHHPRVVVGFEGVTPDLLAHLA